MSSRLIRFHFDYLSPYAYLDWKKVHELASKNEATVEPAPILLAALLNAHGTKGPAEIPVERLYIIKDPWRTARALGLPLAVPPTHPFNPLLPLRISCLGMESSKLRALSGPYGKLKEKQPKASFGKTLKLQSLPGCSVCQR